MKNWFNNLDDKIKKYIVWGTWIACIVAFIIMGSIPEEHWEASVFDDLFAILFLVSLIFAIIFTVWKVKYKNQNINELKEDNNTSTSTQHKTLPNIETKIELEKNINTIKNYQSAQSKVYYDKVIKITHSQTEGRQKILKKLFTTSILEETEFGFLIDCNADIEDGEMASSKKCINVFVVNDNGYNDILGFVPDTMIDELHGEVSGSDGYSVDLYILKNQDIYEPCIRVKFYANKKKEENYNQKQPTQIQSSLNCNLTFIDVETPNKSNNRICSIAIINKVNGKTKYKQNLYVNPEARFDDLNMQIHGITPKMVENAPKFNEIWQDISKYFLNSIVVGHNVQSDLSIISKTLQHYGLNLNTLSFIDTYSLAKKYVDAKSYKLSELTKEFNIEGQTHDALSDCVDCENLLNKIIGDNKLDIYSETEEYYIQHKTIEQPTIYGTIKNTKETKAYQNIQSYISKILEDNEVSNEELKSFIEKVETNKLQDTYPIDKAYKIAIEKLNNAEIDIKKSLSTITGNIDTDSFDGDFEGKLFCLTGDFNHGAKNDIADYIISQGGLVKDNLTLKVDYLVRGLQGSDAYAYGSYGSKVKKALEMKDKGNLIKIITEDDIY